MGINRKAQPIERLKRRFVEFQKRMILTSKPPDDDDEFNEKNNSSDQKTSLLNNKNRNKKHRVPLQIKHVSASASPLYQENEDEQNQDPNQAYSRSRNDHSRTSSNNNNISFTIFRDSEESSNTNPLILNEASHTNNENGVFLDSEKSSTLRNPVLPKASQSNAWMDIGTRDQRRKENVNEPTGWKNVTLPQKQSLIVNRYQRYGNVNSNNNLRIQNGAEAPISFKIYEDPEPDEQQSNSDNNHKNNDTKANIEIQNTPKTENLKNITKPKDSNELSKIKKSKLSNMKEEHNYSTTKSNENASLHHTSNHILEFYQDLKDDNGKVSLPNNNSEIINKNTIEKLSNQNDLKG